MAASVLDAGFRPRAARLPRRSETQVPMPPPVAPGLAQGLTSRVHFWRGASGTRHLFFVYSLLECPPLQPVTFLLVRRDNDGRREILAAGVLERGHATLNLATVRYQGASLGANEVHICTGLPDGQARAAVAAEFALPAPAPRVDHTEEYCSL